MSEATATMPATSRYLGLKLTVVVLLAIKIVTLLNALEKRGLKRGVAAICIGGGEGTAIAIERV